MAHVAQGDNYQPDLAKVDDHNAKHGGSLQSRLVRVGTGKTPIRTLTVVAI